jgi:hypothetical protein
LQNLPIKTTIQRACITNKRLFTGQIKFAPAALHVMWTKMIKIHSLLSDQDTLGDVDNLVSKYLTITNNQIGSRYCTLKLPIHAWNPAAAEIRRVMVKVKHKRNVEQARDPLCSIAKMTIAAGNDDIGTKVDKPLLNKSRVPLENICKRHTLVAHAVEIKFLEYLGPVVRGYK